MGLIFGSSWNQTTGIGLEQIRSPGSKQDAVFLVAEAIGQRGVVIADFWLQFDVRHGLVVERERKTGEFLANVHRETQRIAGSVHTVMIAQVFSTQGDANLGVEVIGEPDRKSVLAVESED